MNEISLPFKPEQNYFVVDVGRVMVPTQAVMHRQTPIWTTIL